MRAPAFLQRVMGCGVMQIPSWYTAGMPPPLVDESGDEDGAEASTSFEDEAAAMPVEQADWTIVKGGAPDNKAMPSPQVAHTSCTCC